MIGGLWLSSNIIFETGFIILFLQCKWAQRHCCMRTAQILDYHFMLIDSELCYDLAEVNVPTTANDNTSVLYSLIGNRWVYVPTRFTSSLVSLRSGLERREKICDCGMEAFMLKRLVSAHLMAVCVATLLGFQVRWCLLTLACITIRGDILTQKNAHPVIKIVSIWYSSHF